MLVLTPSYSLKPSRSVGTYLFAFIPVIICFQPKKSKTSNSIATKKTTQKKKQKLNHDILPDITEFSPSTCGKTSVASVDQTIIKDTNFENELHSSLEEWQNYGLPETILHALKDLKFNCPTQIQKLTLPAAVLGKNKIL